MLNPMLSDSSTRSREGSDGYVFVDIEDVAGGVPASEREQIPNQLSTTQPGSTSVGARPTLTASKLGQYFVFHCQSIRASRVPVR
ncbi:hypothetical protein M427DRAFT_355380 [Gonapodya prolifera JEL478]|uniref:Uncharacterized protein n=1 Tax=Gonapodya prolifera (strain JEL478) TaxID=1344416 RepID=A0A139ABN7_GONPJ|nr:hypothetical protein M427DRAFT_355380 [Gonapodya prolifera JEL478]|eukprot:KXS14167.1 hypothetical protein M427DRAFT_355380 [Gonapodya prolifera JEL478]